MREIKFRAWNKRFKRMEEPRYNSLSEMLNDSFVNLYDDVVLMQYTGLKDKNGKKIFEGDLLQRYVVVSSGFNGDNVRKQDIVQVTFNNGRFGTGEQALPIKEEMVEIIGNVYANPDILSK